MKVIDLLNRIANGEEVPKKIRYDSDTYYYIEDNREGVCYINTALDRENIWSHFLYNISTLNDEVEIIKEDKKIEKLEYIENGDFIEVPSNQELMSKINEIIDYINGGINGE
jgi:hypothetical protein